jgi:hypothetical protein
MHLDALTLFGIAAVSAMLFFYALEHRSHWYVLAFAGTCTLASAYGFLQGAWPFGLVETVWTVVTLRRWVARRFSRAPHGLFSALAAGTMPPTPLSLSLWAPPVLYPCSVYRGGCCGGCRCGS